MPSATGLETNWNQSESNRSISQPMSNAQTIQPKNKSMSWLVFALMTVACWGVYGIFLHSGQIGLGGGPGGGDPNARYKSFLLVGFAYFLIAVLAPLAIIVAKGGDLQVWKYPWQGVKLSFIAGVVGALGAFFVLVAFGAGGKPWVVMSIVFAGAPVVNAVVSLSMHPPKSAIPPQFILGIAMAAVGGCLVTFYKPKDSPPKKPKPAAEEVAYVFDTQKYRPGRYD
jgi:uncharacterized membrane protein YeaQ/YmgE (transglycosylase-associated protein family)